LLFASRTENRIVLQVAPVVKTLGGCMAQSMIVNALTASEGNHEHSNAINFRLI
jgi:hypothetical protein